MAHDPEHPAQLRAVRPLGLPADAAELERAKRVALPIGQPAAQTTAQPAAPPANQPAGQSAGDSVVAYYMDDSGTSMAAPHVSGAIAAFLSIRREFIGTPLEVKRIFLSTASPLGRERYFEGHGLIDLIRAIQSI